MCTIRISKSSKTRTIECKEGKSEKENKLLIEGKRGKSERSESHLNWE